MTRTSLRLRLLLGAAVAIFAALALAWAGISLLIHDYIERREVAQLTALAEQVVAGLAIDSAGRPTVEPAPADPAFQSLASGVYWQVAGPGGTAQSPSLWDQSLPDRPAQTGGWSNATVAGPFGKQLTLVSRRVQPDVRAVDAIVRVGANDEEMREALREFDTRLALSLGLLWFVLSLAAYAQVSLGLRPLDRLRHELDRLRRSPAARLSGRHPQEILPLTEAINAMAAAREADLGRARRRAADLAHSLKTPLAVVAAQSRRARDAGADAAADGIDRAVEAAGAALEAELARSRAAAARGASGESNPQQVAEGLVAVIERTEHGERIIFTVDIDPALRLPVEESDLAEMLGALAENAGRHARRQVRIAGGRRGEDIVLTVEDDGPGMTEAAIARATQRGVRIDETGSGHGFGLAIVRDLAEATETRFHLGRSPLGGLAAELCWTGAEDSRS
ncbi:ATP-binding protein [Sphingopyxis sp. NJF-3]